MVLIEWLVLYTNDLVPNLPIWVILTLMCVSFILVTMFVGVCLVEHPGLRGRRTDGLASSTKEEDEPDRETPKPGTAGDAHA